MITFKAKDKKGNWVYGGTHLKFELGLSTDLFELLCQENKIDLKKI